jgi:antitoxin component YwqK of YwqJK toxin-antitoxin module
MGSGVQLAFHVNGKLWKEVNYKNNLRNGLEKTFDQNGELISTVYYVDDVVTENPENTAISN